MIHAQTLLSILCDPALLEPAWLTIKVVLTTFIIHMVLGAGLGWALAQPHWPGRTLLDIVVTLPLVFPPMALGFFLLILLGRRSFLAEWLDQGLGLSFVFTVEGVILASVIAGLPLVVKPVESAMRALPKNLLEASRTLGHNEWTGFLRIILPNIKGIFIASLILGTARAIGEVGITLMLGGNIIGKTNTISLEIYNAVFNTEYDRAMALSLALAVVSMGVFILLRRFSAKSPDLI